MRSIVFAVCLITLAGCAAEAVQISATENRDIATELLFTHDGCRIYRFHDGAMPVYSADCRGPASTAWNVSCGRNCTRPMTVSTTAP